MGDRELEIPEVLTTSRDMQVLKVRRSHVEAFHAESFQGQRMTPLELWASKVKPKSTGH